VKLRYMVEYALRDGDTNPHYEPIGVWVQGPGPGLDIVMEYLPGNENAQEEADWIINRLVEEGVRSLPVDFLEYHRETMSAYRGLSGAVTETLHFENTERCAHNLLNLVGANATKFSSVGGS
jgi:hypothetical protein